MKNRIAIAGAGSIGCFVGGLLQREGMEVIFLGRARIAAQLARHGLHLTGYSGLDVRVRPDEITISDDPALLADANCILVCVKSGASRAMAKDIGQHANPSATVVSLQNGVRNADILREELPGMDVRGGMVGFNVVQMDEGRFHQGTSGEIVIEAGQPDVATLMQVPELEVRQARDIRPVQWGKLLVNLNNALNALSDMPLVEELSDRTWRKKLANQMEEALAVMKAEGIKPDPPSPVPAGFIPKILRLPTPVFKLVAKQMLAMDPQARSSMWEDLQQGRKTEIGELQGEIVKLGDQHGIPTPVNRDIMEKIQAREQR